MNCTEAHVALLQSLDESLPVDELAALRAHIDGCTGCERFAAAQRALDDRLDTLLTPPAISRSFRTDLRRRIRSDAKPAWPAMLPDAVHFVTCGVATALCALVLPFDAPATLGVGAVATGTVYVLLTIVRDALELADGQA